MRSPGLPERPVLWAVSGHTFRYGDIVEVQNTGSLPFLAYICDERNKLLTVDDDIQLQVCASLVVGAKERGRVATCRQPPPDRPGRVAIVYSTFTCCVYACTVAV